MNLIKTKLQNGMRMWYRSDDKFVGQRIALGKYEEYEGLLILRNVTKNSVAVDIGANIGYYTLLLAGVCKKVYALEPDLESFLILKKNVLANKLKNVVLINKAASDKKETRKLVVDRNNYGNSRLVGSEDLSVMSCESTKTIVLDDEIKDMVNLIKIDTQGWEIRVIMGARKIIKKYRPILFLEFNGDYKMIKFLKKYYKNIFTIDYWFYILRSGIQIDKKTGYADLVMGIKSSIFEQYRNVQWKKVIKKILGYNKLWRK